jgi:hypothetical protein
MAKANPTDLDDPVSPAEADARTQSAVLATLLAEYPIQLTAPELLRQLAAEPDDFAGVDAVERAVRDLTGIGLLHRHGAFVLPSRVALYLDGLERNGGEASGELC